MGGAAALAEIRTGKEEKSKRKAPGVFQKQRLLVLISLGHCVEILLGKACTLTHGVTNTIPTMCDLN